MRIVNAVCCSTEDKKRAVAAHVNVVSATANVSIATQAAFKELTLMSGESVHDPMGLRIRGLRRSSEKSVEENRAAALASTTLAFPTCHCKGIRGYRTITTEPLPREDLQLADEQNLGRSVGSKTRLAAR